MSKKSAIILRYHRHELLDLIYIAYTHPRHDLESYDPMIQVCVQKIVSFKCFTLTT
jgi:hypothetical protein